MLQPRLHPFFRLLFFAIGSIVLVCVVGIVVAVALQISRRATPSAPPLDFSAPGVALFFSALTFPPLLLWVWFCRHVLDRRNYVSLGLGLTRAGRNFAAGGALGALAIALVFAVLLLCGGARINGISPEAFSASASTIAGMLLFYGALFFAVGYFEEVVCRGYLLQNFSAWWGRSAGIAAQAAVFAVLHLLNPGQGEPINRFFAMLNIMLIGWLLALCYLKSGSLWYSIGFHAAWNFFLGCVFSLPVSGTATFHLLDVSLSENAPLTGGEFGPEASVLPVLISLALIWQARRLPDHTRATNELDALRYDHAAPLPEVLATPRTQNEVAPLPEDEGPTREYSPPRYKTTLGAPPRRAAAIDWSDVNTRGSTPTTATFVPGAPPAATISASTPQSTGTASDGESAPSAVPATPDKTPREDSPVAFTPNIAPPAANVAATGEAPLPAAARVTASRSNFGPAAPAPVTHDDVQVLSPSAAETSGVTASRRIEEPPRVLSAPPTLPAPPSASIESAPSRVEEPNEASPMPLRVPAPPPLPAAPPLLARDESKPSQEVTPRRVPPPASEVRPETSSVTTAPVPASPRKDEDDTIITVVPEIAGPPVEEAVLRDETEEANIAAPQVTPTKAKPRW